MVSLLQQVGPEVPLALVLLALLGLRARVIPKVSLLVKAPAQRVWEQINPYDGKVDQFARSRMAMRLMDATSQTYEVTWTAVLPTGNAKPFSASFRVTEREAERKLVLQRIGLDGKSERNELLEIHYVLAPESSGTRLKTKYVWGSRPLLAQLLARADLWGGVYRLKGLAETGRPDEKAYFWIGALMAVVTGLLTLVTFGFTLGKTIGLGGGMAAAAIVVLVLFVHEFGHILAFRLIGQPWGRIVFLPFLGAIAVPRLRYETQAQCVFSALMGPGFSIVLLIICSFGIGLQPLAALLLAVIGLATAGINLFNLLPVEPLDGGVALRPILARLFGRYASLALLGIGLLLVAILGLGLFWAGTSAYVALLIVVACGGFAVFTNFKRRKVDSDLTPLTSLQVCIAFFSYVAIAATHYTMLIHFMDQIKS